MTSSIVITIFVGFLLFALCIYQRQRDRDAAEIKHGGNPAVQHRAKEPFAGLDFHLIMHTDIPSLHRYHQRHGKTFQVRPLIAQPTFETIAPANVRVINTGKDWGVEQLRRPGAEFFCGRGFLTTDGDVWQRSRKLLKPTFAKKNLQDLGYLSQQVDEMFTRLPEEGITVDLQPLFFTMVVVHVLSIKHKTNQHNVVPQYFHQIPLRRGPYQEFYWRTTYFRPVHCFIPRCSLPYHVSHPTWQALVASPSNEIFESL
jgi:hypothetical protein